MCIYLCVCTQWPVSVPVRYLLVMGVWVVLIKCYLANECKEPNGSYVERSHNCCRSLCGGEVHCRRVCVHVCLLQQTFGVASAEFTVVSHTHIIHNLYIYIT